MDALTLITFVLGFVLLIAGAEWLVNGASRLAAAWSISPLVIGLTVVAFGTSAPELGVSLQSALSGKADIMVGNVVGSNICNVLLILGTSALAMPLLVQQQLVRLEVPFLIVASVGFFLLGLDGVLETVDGLVLFAAIVIYTVYAIRKSRAASRQVREDYDEEFGLSETAPASRRGRDALLILAGLVALAVGARWLVDGAVAIARIFEISELVIGLTVIALGTSLPELAASVIAAFRGHRDIAVGNVIGSSLFNLLAVAGATALIAPGGVPVGEAALRFDIPIMIATAFACLPIFFTGYRINRWEGALFLAYYVAYVVYLVLFVAEHQALETFGAVMFFVIPLTLITLLVLAWRALRQQRNVSPG